MKIAIIINIIIVILAIVGAFWLLGGTKMLKGTSAPQTQTVKIL